MGNIWSNERNRLLVENVASELCVCFNYNIPCENFYMYVLQQPKLLATLKSEKNTISKTEARSRFTDTAVE